MNDTPVPFIPITRPNPVQQTVEQDSPKYPTETIDLPSKGWFYPENHPLSVGKIELKPMTAREEDILTNDNLIKRGTVIDKLIESLIVSKQIKLRDMFLIDKNAVTVAVRRLAYGDNYGPVSIRCLSCGTDGEAIIDLSLLRETEFNFDSFSKGVNRFEFILPSSGRKIGWKLLTQTDEESIDVEIKTMEKISKDNVREFTTRLKYMIVDVDGVSDKSKVRNFVDNEFLSKDTREFRKHVASNTPALDNTFEYTCSQCGKSERRVLPITAEFFWPKT